MVFTEAYTISLLFTTSKTLDVYYTVVPQPDSTVVVYSTRANITYEAQRAWVTQGRTIVAISVWRGARYSFALDYFCWSHHRPRYAPCTLHNTQLHCYIHGKALVHQTKYLDSLAGQSMNVKQLPGPSIRIFAVLYVYM